MVEIWLKYPAPTMGFPPAPVKVDYETKVFSGGEVHVKIQQKVQYHKPAHIEIRVKLVSSEDVMRLLMVTAACREQWPNRDIHLVMPYLPFARQDRVVDKGEAFSLKVFTNLINSQKYASVEVWDCHSEVGLALLDNVQHYDQTSIITSFMGLWEPIKVGNVLLISPDAGASKKTQKTASKLGVDFVQAVKVRDPTNGKLSGCKVFGDVGGKHCLIVDDIADGMGTFKQLGEELLKNGAKQVDLYCTHGIFSKGYNACEGVISHIYTTDSIRDLKDAPDYITVRNVFS